MIMAPKIAVGLTCEEFEALAPGLGRAELIDGEIVEMSPAGMPQGFTAMRFATIISQFVDAHKLGWVTCNETGIHVNPPKRRTRAADVLFISYSRLPRDKKLKGFLTIPPELVVEVLGEDEKLSSVLEKVQDYHQFGVDLVWIADPESRTVTVHPLGQPSFVRKHTEVLDGGVALPGFSVPVLSFFS
jgi:Uma2 family endonuclease